MLAPVFGTIGVYRTGSNTSSNALFGNLQKLTAHGLGLSDILMASGGNAGSPAGKMISPQSIVIAAAAAGLLNQEGRIMRQTIKYTIPLPGHPGAHGVGLRLRLPAPRPVAPAGEREA